MKKTFLISCSLLIISFLSSCNKDPGPTIYSGRVLERVSNKPIANARISIRTCMGSFDTGQLSCTELDSIFSDAEGKFSYIVPNSTKYNNFDFAAAKQHYYKDDGTSFYGIESMQRDIFLDAKAWLNLKLERVAPFDEMFISVVGPNSSKFNINSGGWDMDTYYKYEGIYEQLGNDSLQMVWRVSYNDGKYEQKQKGIYLKGLDTTVFTLKF